MQLLQAASVVGQQVVHNLLRCCHPVSQSVSHPSAGGCTSAEAAVLEAEQ